MKSSIGHSNGFAGRCRTVVSTFLVLLLLVLVSQVNLISNDEGILPSKDSSFMVVGKTSTASMEDVPNWRIGDQWKYDTDFDVAGVIAEAGISGASVTTLTGITTMEVIEILTMDIDGNSTLIYKIRSTGTYNGPSTFPSGTIIGDVSGNLEVVYDAYEWVRVSDLASHKLQISLDIEFQSIITEDIADITITTTNIPPIEYYDFPLSVGESWDTSYSQTMAYSGSSSYFDLPETETIQKDASFLVSSKGDAPDNYAGDCSNSYNVSEIGDDGKASAWRWYCPEVRSFSWWYTDIAFGAMGDYRLKQYNPADSTGVLSATDPGGPSPGKRNVELAFGLKSPASPLNAPLDLWLNATDSNDQLLTFENGDFRYEANQTFSSWDTGSNGTEFMTLNGGDSKDDTPTPFDWGSHGIIAWQQSSNRIGVKSLVLDDDIVGVDLVAKTEGITIERTRGNDTTLLTAGTGFNALPGDSLLFSFPAQNRGILQSQPTTMKITAPDGTITIANIPALPGFGEARVSAAWNVPSNQMIGDVSLTFEVDPDKLVTNDADWTNNVGTISSLFVGRAPEASIVNVVSDYTFSNITIDASQSIDPDGGNVSCNFLVEDADINGNIKQKSSFSESCILTWSWVDNGNFSVEVVVIDDEGDNTMIDTNVEVINRPPWIDIGRCKDQTCQEIWTSTNSNLVTVEDAITFSATDFGDLDSTSPADSIQISMRWPDSTCAEGVKKFQCTIYPSIEGENSITAIAIDDDGEETETVYTYNVLNKKPRVENIAANRGGTLIEQNQQMVWSVYEDESVTFDGFADDSMNDMDTLKWKWSSKIDGSLDPVWVQDGEGPDSTIDAVWTDSGEYTLDLSLTDNDEEDSFLYTRWVRVHNVAPVVDDIPNQVPVGEERELTIQGIATDTESDKNSLKICWDIDPVINSDLLGTADDDCDYEGTTLAHSWKESGDYMIIFHATDDDGERTSKSTVIEVRNQPPIARINVDQETVYAGEFITFSANDTVDSTQDKNSLVYLWDSDIYTDSDGDGDSTNDLDHNGMIFKTKYTTPGKYIVSLTVKDENECETSLCKIEIEIDVKSRPGGVFGQYVEDAGISWFTAGLIFVLFVSTIMLIGLRRRHTRSDGENWDSETLGAAMTSSMPIGPPPDAAFELQPSQETTEDGDIEQFPIPESGIPEGWTIEQWNYYGKSWTTQHEKENGQKITPSHQFDDLDI